MMDKAVLLVISTFSLKVGRVTSNAHGLLGAPVGRCRQKQSGIIGKAKSIALESA